MLNSFCRTSFTAILLGLAPLATSSAALAQEARPVTALDKQLGRIDFGLAAQGEFTTSDNGTTYLNQSLAQKPSSTVGYEFNLRYIKSPLFGLEANYSYARYANNFTLGASTTYSDPAATYDVQANVKEYSFGYVAHMRQPHLHVKPFAGAGIGTLRYQPTVNGGEGFKEQYRMLYFGELGAETYLKGDHFGFRVAMRELYHNAPDFLTNYVTLAPPKRVFTTAPVVGFFVRF